MKKIKLNIRNKIIGIMILVIVIPILILGIGAYNTSSNMMIEQNRQLGTTIGNEVGYILDTQIEDIDKTLDYIASSPSIVNLIDNPEEVDMVRNIFRRSIENYGAETIYFGTKNGDIYIESSSDNYSENIDALSRPWYKDAVEKDAIVWSNEYVGQITGSKIVTVSKPVYKGDELLGVIGMDFTLDSFTEIMSKVKISEKDYPILMDNNGIIIGYKDKSWLGQEFQPKKEVLNLKSGTKLVDYTFEDKKNNIKQEQLIVLTTIEKTGWKVATMFSMDYVNESKNSIIKNIILAGIISGFIGIIISIIFGKGISLSINKVLEVLRKMEQGDLTSRIDIKSDDEFGQIGDSFNGMIIKLSSLIKDIKEASTDVGEHSGSLAAISQEVSASSFEISTTVEEIAKGASDQASDTEKGVSLIGDLSEALLELDNSSNEMQSLADNIKKTSDESTEVLQELKEKTEINNDSTNRVEKEIITLDERIGMVSNILSAIDAIAEQTNLLALNASIEAARAGEHGKGFAVVAEEIRKLAGESKKSSNNIKEIIDNVQSESKVTVDVVKDVKERNHEQTEAVFRVNESFDTINKLIQEIISKINNISEQSSEMNKNRDNIVNSMQNISSVSEETAAASEEVTASIEQQTAATEDIANSANKLNELATILSEEINVFKI